MTPGGVARFRRECGPPVRVRQGSFQPQHPGLAERPHEANHGVMRAFEDAGRSVADIDIDIDIGQQADQRQATAPRLIVRV